MEKFELEIGLLEFDDDTHTYYFNGKKCISVTQLLKKKFPQMYDGINEEVLKAASEKGTWVHECIEMFEQYGLKNEDLIEFNNYLLLKSYYRFKVLENEIPIVIVLGDIVIAGRLDMIIQDINDGVCICDIKSTSVLHYDYLSWQTSLYKLGFEQTYKDKYEISGLKAIHLKGRNRKYVSIKEIKNEELINFIKENT